MSPPPWSRSRPISCDFCGAKNDDDRKFVAGLSRYTCEKCIAPAFKDALWKSKAGLMAIVCSVCDFQNDGKRRFMAEKISFICDECVSLATERLGAIT
jgi:ATP-dependent protease Clp ATPase subunit